MGLTRNDVVIGVGGGMVTDVAGFAAAVVAPRRAGRARRRPRCSAWSTRRSAARPASTCREGKNLVGAFWQPSRRGLRPRRARPRCRRASVRCGRRRDGQVPLPHRRRPAGDDDDRPHRPLRRDQGRRSSPSDEREGGRRALLNYGHTLAHALEIATDYELAHGEAVAVGLSTPPSSPVDLGRIDDRARRRALDVVGGTLRARTTTCPPGSTADELVDADGPRQEGARRADVRARRPRGVEVVAGVAESAARRRRSTRMTPPMTDDPVDRAPSGSLLREWRDADRPPYARSTPIPT